MPNVQAPWPVENASAATLKILDASSPSSSAGNEEEDDESLYQAKNLQYLETRSNFALKPNTNETLNIDYEAEKDWDLIFAQQADLFPVAVKELDFNTETGKYEKSTIPERCARTDHVGAQISEASLGGSHHQNIHHLQSSFVKNHAHSEVGQGKQSHHQLHQQHTRN
ncbi:hypothetical protein ACPRNU_18880 [Chromobacterium vaccinii]|uniref:hypothetical protein n=1 Tax=Chromobacterium vaccinii TaxID=1108595 RepID=UPI003C73CFC2